MLEDAREQLIAALQKLPYLQHREGRDDVVDDLPEEIGSRIKRRQNLAADVRAIVKACIDYENGLAALFAILKSREGNSLPFQHACSAWENYQRQMPAGENAAGDWPRESAAPPGPVPTMTLTEQVENAYRIFLHGRREQTLFILAVLCFGLAYWVPATLLEKLPELLEAFKTVIPRLDILAYILLAWLAVLLWQQTPSRKTEISDTVKPRAIKGPFPFAEQDGEVFAKLGRKADLEKILGWVVDPQTGFTALKGESGAGKTSLLRAGLTYLLNREWDKYGITPIYWEAVPDNPGEALLRAVRLACPKAEAERLQTLDDLIDDITGSPKAIIIDQAEQLSPEKHPAMFELFRRIIARKAPYRTTWIIAFREEYASVWFDFETTIPNFNPPKHALKIFSEGQARENMTVLARESGLAPDKAVLDEMVGAMSENGRVSPVEIGIGMMVLSELYRGPENGISLGKFHDAGGVTGLLRAYIQDKLEEDIPAHERSPLQGALLELIDPETPRQRLAQGKTAPELARAAQLPLNRIRHHLRRLASRRVRILEQLPGEFSAEAEPRYRLAHERLIPALESLAGILLAAADQARRLLNERYRAWAKTKRGKFLLSGKELRDVLKYRGHFKEILSPELLNYIRASKRRRYQKAAAVALFLLAVLLWQPFYNGVIEPWKRAQRLQAFEAQFIAVPGGVFAMGDSSEVSQPDESPVHDVKLHDFRISRYEITNQQYCDFLNDDDSAVAKVKAGEWIAWDNEDCDIKLIEDRFVVKSAARINYPVVMVDWYGAAAFANYLNRHTGYTPFFDRKSGTREVTAKGYRLPTEAEWEYAARGGAASKEYSYSYSGSDSIDTVAWYWDNSGNEIHPVGKKMPNVLGLHDMSGNVWEWCMDWYGEEYYAECQKKGTVQNPGGPEKGSNRVLRGGGWGYYALGCRSAYRFSYHPAGRNLNVGFRLVFVP